MNLKGLSMQTQKILFFENFWTVTETAEFLNVSPKTIYDWVHKREIPFHKLKRLLRFRRSEIEKWLAGNGGHCVDRQDKT